MGLEVNILDTFNKFAELTAQEMTRATKKAVNRAAAELKSTTLSELQSTGISNAPNPKYTDTLYKGIRMRKAGKVMYDEDVYSVVHVLGSRDSGSGTFRLRFFENGTQDRYQQSIHGTPLKKPRYVGKIKPEKFFARANSSIEGQLSTIYMEEIDKAIEKINNNNS